MKTNARNFMELKTNIEAEIKCDVQHIAIYADNLTKTEALSVDEYLKSAVDKYDIDYHIYDIRNVLHDNTKFYERYVSSDSHLGWMAVELANIIYCDEVWVFDNGYDNYELDGRLDNVITQFEKPVKFLAKTPDNKSWDFYRARDVIRDSAGALTNDYYLIVDSFEIITPEPVSVGNLKALSESVLSIKEYGIAHEAFELIQTAGSLSIKAAVRNDDVLCTKINDLIKSCSDVMLAVLSNSNSDSTLGILSAKLDFIRPEFESLINDYDL